MEIQIRVLHCLLKHSKCVGHMQISSGKFDKDRKVNLTCMFSILLTYISIRKLSNVHIKPIIHASYLINVYMNNNNNNKRLIIHIKHRLYAK